MKIIKLFSILLIFTTLFFGCKNFSKTGSSEPTKKGALVFAKKFWKLVNEKKHEKTYELLSREDKSLVTKANYIKTLKEDDKNNKAFPVNVLGVAGLKGDKAIVTISTKNPAGGTVSYRDAFIFENGEWRHRLSTGGLLFYGVAPEKIKSIKKTSMYKRIITHAFEAIIIKMEESSTSKGSDGSSKTAEGKYVCITSAIKNKGKQKLNFNEEQYFTLIDSKQRNFEYSYDTPGETLDTEISPGTVKIIKTYYDVPKDAKGFRLLVGEGNEQFLVYLK